MATQKLKKIKPPQREDKEETIVAHWNIHPIDMSAILKRLRARDKELRETDSDYDEKVKKYAIEIGLRKESPSQ